MGRLDLLPSSGMNSEPSRDTVRLACLPHCHPERHRASFNRQVYTATARAPSAHARIAVSAFYGFAARGLPLNGRGARRTRGDRRQKGDAPGARQRCPRSPHGASDSPATPRAQEAPRGEGARARSAEPGPPLRQCLRPIETTGHTSSHRSPKRKIRRGGRNPYPCGFRGSNGGSVRAR